MSDQTNDESIPPPAALIRDFVNTVEWQVDADQWASPADAQRWFAKRVCAPAERLGEQDVDLARRIREGIRGLLLMNAGHDPLATTIEDLNDALGHVSLRVAFGSTGSFRFGAVAGSALAQPVAMLLEAVDSARGDGSWLRLKACSRESCRWAYWDGSRNRSGRWCAMAGCGNYVKMRRRNSPLATEEDTIPATEGDFRRPTLLDVAGRAGVSMKTVSNVVTGAVRVSESTRSRVQAVIDELDYRPDLAARALSARRAR